VLMLRGLSVSLDGVVRRGGLDGGHGVLLGTAAGRGQAVDGASVARLRKERRRRLLPTTNTLENAIAAPASIGFSSPSAASGIAAVLYAKAQNRLPLMVERVRRDRRIASAAARRSPRTRVMSPASIATSVPVPIADRKSTRLNSSHVKISYAVFCLKKKRQR